MHLSQQVFCKRTPKSVNVRFRPHILVLPSLYPTQVWPLDGIYVQDQAQMLFRAKCDVGVLYPEYRSWRTLQCFPPWKNHFQTGIYHESGVKTFRLHGWNIPRFKVGTRVWMRMMMKLFTQYISCFGKPDLCHAHNCLWAGLAAKKIFDTFSIPYIVTEHSTAHLRGILNGWERQDVQEALREASAILVVGDSLKQRLVPYAHDKQIIIVSNVVDTIFFRRPTHRAKTSTFRLLTVAHLVERKGIDLLLRAFSKAFGGQESFSLEICGDGPERRKLERLAQRLKLSSQAKFLGARDREGVRDAMWRANLFVLPSKVETFGVVLVEALASGLPVVATRSGGPENIIIPEVGFLVENGNVNALASTLTLAHQQYGIFNEEALHQHADVYSEAAISAQVLGVYGSVLHVQ